MINHFLNTSALHALFGGTFDPIHYGHLWPVEALAKEIGLDKVTMLPNYMPPHKAHLSANAQQRLKMVELAITGNPLFTVDDLELRRTNVSYTIETLESIREKHGITQPLAFIIGYDSLLTLNQWYRWQSLLDLCHLLVLARSGHHKPLNIPIIQQLLERHRVTDIRLLNKQTHGCIYLANTPTLNISATKIRLLWPKGQYCNDMLPSSVIHYIKSERLYL
ncbi:nicotinate-nucleotide adenylyltransferase [Serratia symbiotica str. 'Cinara cedri']|nr:nicotinate-nucleotide adenylyltransferase [Serratia symbiotica str. 'Cinara cedri']